MGAATTVTLGAALLAFVSLVLNPLLISMTSTGPVNGATSTTVTQERVRGFFLLLSLILTVSSALLTGGFVAGRFASSHAALNGALVGFLLVSIPLLWLVGSLAFVLFEPIRNPGDVYGRSENIRMLGVALVVYSVVSPVFVLASFLGGRIGGRAGREDAGPGLQSG